MKKFSSYRGVTLVETLVVLALFLLISAFFVGLSLQYSKLYQLGESQFMAVGSARSVLNSMSAYVPQARQVVTSRSISGVTYTTGTSTLVLELPAINQNGDVISNTSDYVVFYKSGSEVFRHVDANAVSARDSGLRTLGSTIAGLIFTYDNVSTTLATKVSVDIDSNRTSGHVTVTNHETASFILRNF